LFGWDNEGNEEVLCSFLSWARFRARFAEESAGGTEKFKEEAPSVQVSGRVGPGGGCVLQKGGRVGLL